MSGWSYAKYALAMGGLALVLLGENIGRRWLGYPGIALIVVAFLLRFPQRSIARRRKPTD